MIASLPPLPVDDVSLGLYWSALHPDPDEASRTSITSTLRMLAEMAGADLTDDCQDPSLRDPMYHLNDLVSALIVALRDERAA